MADRFSPTALLAALNELLGQLEHRPRRLCIALSGGADSSALLLASSEIGPHLDAEIVAVHVNHGAHADSDRWQNHCSRLCQEVNVPLTTLSVNPDLASGKGPEAKWREQRYQAMEQFLRPGDALLTAHHLDDQAETLMLKLMRGQGLPGLAAMPGRRALGEAVLLRPLLGFSGSALRSYLRSEGHHWMEDPSNQNADLDRAYIRHQLLPMLEQRWPAAKKLLARSSEHAREALELNNHWCGQNLRSVIGTKGQFQLKAIPGRNTPLLKALIRFWLLELGAPPLPGKRLAEFCRQLEHAGSDSAAQVRWSNCSLRLYRDELWFLGERTEIPLDSQPLLLNKPVALGAISGVVLLRTTVEPDGRQKWSVQHRSGGQHIQVGQRNIFLKEWLRAQGLAPWLRDHVPLLVDGQNVLAVGDCLLSSSFKRWLDHHKGHWNWKPSDPLLAHWRQSVLPGG